MIARRCAVGMGLVLVLVLGLLALFPRGQAQAQNDDDRYCFTEEGGTNLCIEGRIREFWEQNGGLPVFGYPITPQISEQVEGEFRPVQWFERNRLELHPGNTPPYDVLLGRIGVEALEKQGRNWFTFQPGGNQPGCRYFPETDNSVCEPFLSAWRANGLEFDGQPGTSEAESLALFGMPISPVQQEEIEGTMFQVQWFERARFELHPENPPDFQVQFGLLGNTVRQVTDNGGGDSPADDTDRLAFTSLQGSAGEGRNQDVYVCTLTGDNTGCYQEARLTNIPQNDGQPTWSPDGSQIAFESDLDGDWDIYTIGSNGAGGHSLLTNNGDVDGAPSWAHIDGLGWRIAFHSNRDAGNFDVYLIDAGNPDATQRLTSDGTSESNPALSPDGSHIAFVSDRGGGINVYVVDMTVSGNSVVLGEWRNVTEGLDGASGKPTWSPDGQRLVFENTQNDNAEIYVVNADGSGRQNLTNNPASDESPGWSPDGSRIAFQSNREGGIYHIYIMQADGSNLVRVNINVADVVHPTWMP